MPDGKQWTTENLNVNISASYCYEGSEANCRRYGRLYTGESARRRCESLGDGWRLPAEDEWPRLEAHGFYWTASASDSASAWFYNFGKGSLALYRQREGNKQMAVSVRCIND